MSNPVDFSQFENAGQLRNWAEKVALENQALKAAEETRRKADLDSLLDNYDPRVRALVPEGVDVRKWLSDNGDLFPKKDVESSAAQPVNTAAPEAQAPQSPQVPADVQQGFQLAESAVAQGTGAAPTEVSTTSDALRAAINSGGVDALDRLLAEQGLTGSVNG